MHTCLQLIHIKMHSIGIYCHIGPTSNPFCPLKALDHSLSSSYSLLRMHGTDATRVRSIKSLIYKLKSGGVME
jgi:hypothetical protein